MTIQLTTNERDREMVKIDHIDGEFDVVKILRVLAGEVTLDSDHQVWDDIQKGILPAEWEVEAGDEYGDLSCELQLYGVEICGAYYSASRDEWDTTSDCCGVRYAWREGVGISQIGSFPDEDKSKAEMWGDNE